ncbi:MAG: DUF6515 family protein [Ferruginibacter sp.]
MKTTISSITKKTSVTAGLAILFLCCLTGLDTLAQGNRDRGGDGGRRSSVRDQSVHQQSQPNINRSESGALNRSRGQDNQNAAINRPQQGQFNRDFQNRSNINRIPSQDRNQGSNSTIPDRNIGRIGGNSGRTDNNYNRPGNSNNRPDNGYNRPGNNNSSRPNYNYNRPNNNNYNRPGNNYNRQDRAFNRPGNDYYNRNRGYNNGYNNGYRRPTYSAGNPNWRYAYAPRRNSIFNSLPSSYFSINFGGFGYRYYDGIFYRPYNNVFRVVVPPIGIYVNVLPLGYSRIYVHDYPYYYYNGTYYDYRDNNYTVVSPPVGAVVESIPDGFETIVADGETYYVADGAQYKPVVQENGEIWYEVIKAN